MSAVTTTNIKPFFYEILDGISSAGGFIAAKTNKSTSVDDVDVLEKEAEQAPPPAPTFSLEEMEIAKNLAREEGISKGYADAKASLERELEEKNLKLNELTAKLLEQTVLISEQIRVNQGIISAELAQIALSAAKAICKNIDEEIYSLQLESIIKQSLEKVGEDSKPKIYLNPKNAAELNDKFTGVTVNASEEIELGDFRLEWNKGYLERNAANIWQEVELMIGKHFNKTELTNGE